MSLDQRIVARLNVNHNLKFWLWLKWNLGYVKLKGWLASSLSSKIRGGILIMSQGLMGVFTAILLTSGCCIRVWWLKLAKCFYCSLPFPPPPKVSLSVCRGNSSVMVPGWMPLPGLSRLHIALGCSLGLHKLHRHFSSTLISVDQFKF